MASYTDGLKITEVSNGSLSSGKNGDVSSSSNRTSLVSSYQKRHYGTVNKGQWKANGFVVHTLEESDTLQGIALKYSVPVAEIQRFNNLFSNDSIHLHTELRIPYLSSMNSSPSSSPRAAKKRISDSLNSEQSDGGRNFTGSSSLSADEEEVKQKPLAGRLTDSGEKDIKCLLDTVDIQLQKSKDFAERLALKNSVLKTDGYNREPVEVPSSTTEEDETASIRDKFKRVFGRTGRTPNTANQNNREQVEDEIFQL